MLVVCVIDVSGSMSGEAKYEQVRSLLALLVQTSTNTDASSEAVQDGVEKSDGLTYLDIVKHAVKAVMHMLGTKFDLLVQKYKS